MTPETPKPPKSTKSPKTEKSGDSPQPTRARTREGEKNQERTHARTQTRKQSIPPDEDADRRKSLSGPIPLDSPLKEPYIEKSYDMYVRKQMSFSRIAEALGINRDTVSAYVKFESTRRSEENAAMRTANIERNLESLAIVEETNISRMFAADRRGDEARYVLEACKQRMMLLGLDEGVVIKDERKHANPFEGLGRDELVAILKNAPTGGAFHRPDSR
jgi:predicted transcriptional regulator